LPEISGINFGHGDVEAGANTILEAAQDLTAVFERLSGFNAKFKREMCDGHGLPVSGSVCLANGRREEIPAALPDTPSAIPVWRV
jgi:hypothetical protein